MTWNAFHNRGEILRSVISTADARCDGTLPVDVPGVRENFANELDLIAALLLKWHARLSGNIERELMHQPLDLEHAVVRAWRLTSDEMPGVRAIIDRYCDRPSDAEMAAALQRAQRREWVRLAGAAGLANDESAAAARAGERIELAARALDEVAPAPVETERNSTNGPSAPAAPSGPSFVDRIRAVLAA